VADWENWLPVAVDLLGVSDSLQLTVTVAETEAGDGVRVGANVWEALCVSDSEARLETELEKLVAEWLAVAVELCVTVLVFATVSVWLWELEPVVDLLRLSVMLLEWEGECEAVYVEVGGVGVWYMVKVVLPETVGLLVSMLDVV